MSKKEHTRDRESESEMPERFPDKFETPAEPYTAESPAPKVTSVVTQQTLYNHQLVVDVAFNGENTVKVSHSCHSDALFVSLVNIDPTVAWAIPPSVTFDDADSLTLTQTAGEGIFRVYITVVPH